MNFSEDEIIEIYNKYVKKDINYFNETITDNCPVKKWNNSWKFKDAPRCKCVLDFINWINKYNISNCDILGYTSEDDPEIEFITVKKKILHLYSKNEIDENKLHNDLHTFEPDNLYDFFIFNQTLEHLYNPLMCVKQIFKTIKPGGYVFTSVPTINIPHDTPFNFYNHYPMGLAMLFLSAGFEILETGQWGNQNYIVKLFSTHSWSDIYQVGKHNEEKNVAQCWILCKKPI